jgi:hypothetical protein
MDESRDVKWLSLHDQNTTVEHNLHLGCLNGHEHFRTSDVFSSKNTSPVNSKLTGDVWSSHYDHCSTFSRTTSHSDLIESPSHCQHPAMATLLPFINSLTVENRDPMSRDYDVTTSSLIWASYCPQAVEYNHYYSGLHFNEKVCILVE